MATISRHRVNGTNYDLMDKLARNSINSIDDKELILRFGISVGEVETDKRASTDFIQVTGNMEIYSDDNNPPVSMNITMYTENKEEIADLIPTRKTQIKRLYYLADEHPTAKYIKVYICGYSNSDRSLTDADITYAKRHIKMREGITVKDMKTEAITPSDYDIGRTEYAEAFVQDFTTRATSLCLFKNAADMLLTIDNPGTYQFYLKYYAADFTYVTAGDWHTYDALPYTESTSPYFSVVIRNKNDTEANITRSDIEAFVSHFRADNVIWYGHSINVNGEYIAPGNIRCCERKRRYVNDAYIRLNATDKYCLDIVCFSNETGGTVTKEYGWIQAQGVDFDYVDNGVRIQDCWIQFIFAKTDRTSGFTDAEYYQLVQDYYDGSLFDVIESDDPEQLMGQAEKMYPQYYNSETETTVNTAASKTKYGSVKFAMMTDLHDNNGYNQLAKTTYQQAMAIRDLNEKIGLDFVICGGDLTDGGFSNKAKLLNKMTEQVKMFKKIGVPVLFLRGNHDDNSYAGYEVTKVVSREEWYARVLAPFSGKKIPDGKCYYYQDFDEVNVRVICLDFIDYPWVVNDGSVVYGAGGSNIWRGYSDDQITWLLGTALNCNKRIIVTGHYSTHANLMTTWEKSVEHNYALINQIMEAYNSRGSFTFGGTTYSYADKTGKILVQVSGHSHAFGAFKDGSIVYSTTGSPSPEVTHRVYDDTDYETMGERTYGNITEAHFNVFVCDNSSVNIISYGQMGDKSFSV